MNTQNNGYQAVIDTLERAMNFALEDVCDMAVVTTSITEAEIGIRKLEGQHKHLKANFAACESGYAHVGKAFENVKAERDRLREELSACTGGTGGCGYWREAAKLRAQEHDRLREAIKDAIRVIDSGLPKSAAKALRDALEGR